MTSPLIFIKDCFVGLLYGIWFSRHHLIHSYVIIPIGIVILFTILYGFNVLLADVFKILFPASVLGMLINLIFLCLLDAIASLRDSKVTTGNQWLKGIGLAASYILEKYLMIIKPCMNFSLKWINVFFIPSFMILPLSDHISFIECLKIAAVFLIGGLGLMIFDVYSIQLLKHVARIFGLGHFDGEKSLVPSNLSSGDAEENMAKHNEGLNSENDILQINRSYISARDDITTIDVTSLRSTRSVQDPKLRSLAVSENPYTNMTKELYTSSDFPMLNFAQTPTDASSADNRSEAPILDQNKNPLVEKGPLQHLSSVSRYSTVFVTNYIDWILFLVLFVVSLPLYYVHSLHIMLFYHLSMTVLAYYVALLIPNKIPQLKKFAHPILVSTALALFICFIGSLIYHHGKPKGFLDDLKFYKTGKTYLKLFNKKMMYNNGLTLPETKADFTAVPLWPGCGDFLSSLMDISIVSLSLPMFTHKRDFVRNFWVLIPPILVSTALTFFCYPLVCYHIGISSERSIGFIGRLVTLALGTPLISTLGGSVSLMAVCTILSGIFGVLVGDLFFRVLKVSPDDYVTRGVTLGINCGAIATAHLLNVDPRAASMSSLSFSIFGTIMIVLASINAIRELITSWVNL